MTTIGLNFSKELYDDIVRLTNGRLDPARLAHEQILFLIETCLNDAARDWFGEQLPEFVRKHLPHCLDDLRDREPANVAGEDDLRWKNITIPAGSIVQMEYAGAKHHAKVVAGKIVDKDGAFSPSQWARKIAQNTSRNAWRDIWFKRPSDEAFKLADSLR